MLRAFFIVFALLAAAPAGAAEFVAGTEDVPLMPGLVAQAGAVVFDKPEGRIVEAEARGKLDRAKVREFYNATLPQLGWSVLGPNAWWRENEVLRIDYRGGGGGDLIVGFTLAPEQETHP
jgi:hypothetical protein